MNGNAEALPRAAIVTAVSTFRSAAEAAGAASWHLARVRLPVACEAMLDQVEVTVAEQPLPRLQAVGSSQTPFPFLYQLSWGPRESFSVARLAAIVDRLTFNGTIIETGTQSYRLARAKAAKDS